jgi:hypothetical protein
MTQRIKFDTSQAALDLCVKYSEKPDVLFKIIAQCSFEYEEQGVRKYFPDDKETRMTRLITITRGEKQIEFDFGMSLHDTALLCQSRWPLTTKQVAKIKNIKNGFLYSILCCIKSDSYCDDTFEDWCGTMGYDTDSRKALDNYLVCQKMARKIRRIFTSKELESFPD